MQNTNMIRWMDVAHAVLKKYLETRVFTLVSKEMWADRAKLLTFNLPNCSFTHCLHFFTKYTEATFYSNGGLLNLTCFVSAFLILPYFQSVRTL